MLTPARPVPGSGAVRFLGVGRGRRGDGAGGGSASRGRRAPAERRLRRRWAARNKGDTAARRRCSDRGRCRYRGKNSPAPRGRRRSALGRQPSSSRGGPSPRAALQRPLRSAALCSTGARCRCGTAVFARPGTALLPALSGNSRQLQQNIGSQHRDLFALPSLRLPFIRSTGFKERRVNSRPGIHVPLN